MRETGTIAAGGPNPTSFQSVRAAHNSVLSIAYFAARHMEVLERGYTILEGFGDPMNTEFIGTEDLPFNRPTTLPTHTRDDFFARVEDDFDLDEALSDKELKNFVGIFNYADDTLDDADRERGVARFSSTWYYTMEYMFNDKNNPWMARFRAFLDTYLGQLCCLVKLQDLNDVQLKFPNSGGRFLLTGEGCPAQVGHNDFDHRLGKGAGFFVMVTGAHPTGLWVCDGSHKNVNQSTRRKLQLADVMRMSLIQIPPNSVFIGHGFLQHAGAAWAGNHCLRYHMYFPLRVMSCPIPSRLPTASLSKRLPGPRPRTVKNRLTVMGSTTS